MEKLKLLHTDHTFVQGVDAVEITVVGLGRKPVRKVFRDIWQRPGRVTANDLVKELTGHEGDIKIKIEEEFPPFLQIELVGS